MSKVKTFEETKRVSEVKEFLGYKNKINKIVEYQLSKNKHILKVLLND